MVVVKNSIDFERFKYDEAVDKNIRKELGIEGKFVIGNVGRLHFQKNQLNKNIGVMWHIFSQP